MPSLAIPCHACFWYAKETNLYQIYIYSIGKKKNSVKSHILISFQSNIERKGQYKGCVEEVIIHG